MSDAGTYSPIGTELQPLTKLKSEDLIEDSDYQSWCVNPCPPCDKEVWKIPFAVGKSCYLPYHLGSKAPVSQEHVYDVLEIPMTINQERDYAVYAEQIIEILHEPHRRSWREMKWNFDSSIKYMNLILYIPELFDELASDETMIPKTALPILGNTLHELISRTKAWIFTSGQSSPICNTIGEGVFKAALQERSLVQGLKKRLEMTGVSCRYVEEDFADKSSSRYLLSDKYCEALSESLSPFSNLHIILKHGDNYELLLEKLLFNLGLTLRLPTLKLVPRINEFKQLIGFDIDFLDPYKTHTSPTSNFYDMLLVQEDLFTVILSKADDFYYRNDDLYTEWNIMTMAIFLNDRDRVKRAVLKSQFASLTDEAQIERIFRYALVYGSRSVVETVFVNETLSKLLRQRAEKILELTFQKSSNEVFLYNRLMIALNIVDDMGKKKKQFNYLTLVKTAIQNLISHGLLWVPPVKMFRGEEVGHLLAFFPEYIMVWGVLSQRFEVIELFLKYSGLHLQYLSAEASSLSTHKGVYQICNALAISAMFRGVGKKLRRDISVTSTDFNNLIKYSKRFDQIATELLDYSLTKDEETLRALLNTPSPFWSDRTALDIAFIGKAYTFLNHNAVQIYLHHLWSGYDAIKQREGERVHARERVAQSILHPYRKSSLILLYLVIGTARLGYFLHGVYFLFVILCIIALLSLPEPEDHNYNFQSVHPLEWVLFICLLGFTIEEFKQYIIYVLNNFYTVGLGEWRIVLKLSSHEYTDSIWNKLDILIVLMFILSVTVRVLSVFIIGFPPNIPRLIYGFAALPIFIRSFQHILVIKAVGPLIYTMYQAFTKMLKFLIIILILSIAAGTIQIALLTPTSSPSIRMRHLIFTPFFQIFGEYFFDDLQSNTYYLIPSNKTCSSMSIGCDAFWERSDFILYIAVAVWILIINVLILNLMIAYFTRIYDEVAADAESIYIWQFIEIVNEFSSRNIFPPPINILFYPTDLIKFLYRLNRKRYHAKESKNALLKIVIEKGKTSNKFNVYFATHYENSFADKYWRSKE